MPNGRRAALEEQLNFAAYERCKSRRCSAVRNVRNVTPAMLCSNSPARWIEVPVPPEPKLIVPGFAFAYLMSSETDPPADHVGEQDVRCLG